MWRAMIWGTLNPPLAPPRRGTDRTRTNACSPPGRGWGWVGLSKGTVVHPPFPRLCPHDRSQLRWFSGLGKSALVASLGFSPFSAGALLHCAGPCRRTRWTSRSGPAQFRAREFAVGILVQTLQGHSGVVDFGGIDDPVVVGIQRGDHEWSGRLGTLGGPSLAAGGQR